MILPRTLDKPTSCRHDENDVKKKNPFFYPQAKKFMPKSKLRKLKKQMAKKKKAMKEKQQA